MESRIHNLPRLMLVTQRAMMNPFAQVLEAALQDGARLIQLREKDLEARELLDLAIESRAICKRYGATLIVNHDEQAARWACARGVQRSARQIDEEFMGRSANRALLIGASVHSLDEAQSAQALGADYLVLGSIFPTNSHPGGETLGLQVLEEIAREISVPIFAIGGINSQNARDCLDAGAHGVAAISAAWDGDERRALLREVGDV